MGAEPNGKGTAEARAALEEALPLAQGLKDPDARLQALGCLLEAFATVDPARAVALADQVSDPEERDSAIFEVALTVGRREPEQALVIVRHYRTGALEDSEIERLAGAIAPAWPEKAVELVGGMEDRFAFYGAVAEVAAAMAEAHPEPALALARSIGEPALRAEALRRVAIGQLASRPDLARVLGDEVVKLAPEVEEGHDRAQLLAETAGDLASASREWAKEVADLALAAAREAPEEDSRRDGALRAVAVAMAQLYPDRAEEVAHTIKEPTHRGRALAGIARVIAPASPSWARRLADEAVEAAQRAARDDLGVRAILDAAIEALSLVDPRDALASALHSVAEGNAEPSFARPAAEALAKTHPEEVLAAAEQARDPVLQEALLSACVQATHDYDVERALAIAATMKDRRDLGLCRIASSVAWTDPARASEIARGIADPYTRVLALCEAAWHVQGLEM